MLHSKLGHERSLRKQTQLQKNHSGVVLELKASIHSLSFTQSKKSRSSVTTQSTQTDLNSKKGFPKPELKTTLLPNTILKTNVNHVMNDNRWFLHKLILKTHRYLLPSPKALEFSTKDKTHSPDTTQSCPRQSQTRCLAKRLRSQCTEVFYLN